MELLKDLNHLIETIKGLQMIIISDRDGIPIISAMSDNQKELTISKNSCPVITGIAGIACEQASKLGLGKCKSVTCLFDAFQIVHFSKNPIIISLIAKSKANTGLLLSLESQFDPIVGSLRKVVQIKPS